mgnify:CR=1 FL=1
MTLGLAIIGLAVVGYLLYKGVLATMDHKADKKPSTTKKDKNDN